MQGPSVHPSQRSFLRREGKVMATFDDGKALIIRTTPSDKVEISIEDSEPDAKPATFILDEAQAAKLVVEIAEMIRAKRLVRAEMNAFGLAWAHNAAAVKGANEQKGV